MVVFEGGLLGLKGAVMIMKNNVTVLYICIFCYPFKAKSTRYCTCTDVGFSEGHGFESRLYADF